MIDAVRELHHADTELHDEVVASRIVVPLSGSYHSMRAVPHAADLARRLGATLSLVTVPDPLEHERPFAVPGWMHDLRDRVDLDRVELVVTEPGDRARRILDFAHGPEPTAICFATHARSGASELVHHRVARTVLRDARDPVWVIGRDCTRHPRTGPIVICDDGFDGAGAVVGVAAAWAHRLGVPARLVRAGDPVEAITDHARVSGACAIAVAVPSGDGGDEVTIGDLPSGLVRQSPCPVLLVRGGAR